MTMKIATSLVILCIGALLSHVEGFTTSTTTTTTTFSTTTTTQLYGLFDRFTAFGSADQDDLDEQWEAQQAILKARRSPQRERDAYFGQVEERRKRASEQQQSNWAWQTKTYAKGEDPINEWKKKRQEGVISDLDNQYGDPKKVGGIPLPMASFGVGGVRADCRRRRRVYVSCRCINRLTSTAPLSFSPHVGRQQQEFGVGGKFDNGGRFDLRLPYADQGYVDEDSDVMGKLSSFFGGGKKKAPQPEQPVVEEEKPKKNWPF